MARLFSVVVLAAVCYWAYEGCFARIAGTRLEEPPATEEVEAPAAAAWLRAARRTAEGKKDSGAHWEAAWEMTEAWWLRPVAFSVTALFTLVAIIQQLPGAYLRAIIPKARTEKVLPLEAGPSKELQVAKCLRALQRMELPVFGTSAAWSEKLQGTVVSVNPRPGALEDWEQRVEPVQQSLEEVLEQPVVVHLLRQSQEKSGASESWELLVTEPRKVEEGYMNTLLSFGAVVGAAQLVSSLRVGAPLAPVLLLLLLAEAAKSATARAQDTELGARTWVPCPQLGALGLFSASGASPSRGAQLRLALSGPAALAALALLLSAWDWAPSWTIDVHNTMGLGMLTGLQGECHATAFIARQALLMAGLALLPQSPEGKAAWAALVGRETANKMAEAAGYLYPLCGVLAMWGGAGPMVLSLPFTWALLLTNLQPSETPPPLEEATEVPWELQTAAAALLLSAPLAVLPGVFL
ncbi:unnamed protein product [Effrenium voratum]|uniref:Uncharacterized protein n=1 Tax=Effrenium voratum TaxID=2562239 RepID=A0AA36NIT5_9DINO|nr:unnamed protein product [Effrenium voratum]CAJ1451723.1 unnamed protein product [Effrenium voratum]